MTASAGAFAVNAADAGLWARRGHLASVYSTNALYPLFDWVLTFIQTPSDYIFFFSILADLKTPFLTIVRNQ